jgi:hypothetical protein
MLFELLFQSKHPFYLAFVEMSSFHIRHLFRLGQSVTCSEAEPGDPLQKLPFGPVRRA